MLVHLRPAAVCLALFTLLLGLAYPLAITGLAQLTMPRQAGGSLIRADGQVVGSALIGQRFQAPGYLHPRPSAAGAEGYDASASSGSNLGPLNPVLIQQVATRAQALRAETGADRLPADAVTASASGLDPHISPAYAELQAPRIAAARGADPAEVRAVLASATQGRTFGFLGQPRVNVLIANLALDARWPAAQPRGR